MQVLITGIAGFIGSRLAGWILENVPGAEVIGIDNLFSGFRENIPAGAWWKKATLGAGRDWTKDFRPNYVFHCAAYVAEGLSPFVRRHNYLNNVVATAEVVVILLPGEGGNRPILKNIMRPNASRMPLPHLSAAEAAGQCHRLF